MVFYVLMLQIFVVTVLESNNESVLIYSVCCRIEFTFILWIPVYKYHSNVIKKTNDKARVGTVLTVNICSLIIIYSCFSLIVIQVLTTSKITLSPLPGKNQYWCYNRNIIMTFFSKFDFVLWFQKSFRTTLLIVLYLLSYSGIWILWVFPANPGVQTNFYNLNFMELH